MAFGGTGTPRDKELSRLKRELAWVKADGGRCPAKWVTDITEIKTRQGKLSLCIVLDLFDQRIVGWPMHHR